MYKTLILLTYLVTTQSGCAVYTGMSAASTVSTGKSITEHTVSQLTGYDCGVRNWIRNQTYLCEQHRDAGTHYVTSLD